MSRSDPRSRDELISDISEHVVEEIRGQAAVVSVRLICRLAWINTRLHIKPGGNSEDRIQQNCQNLDCKHCHFLQPDDCMSYSCPMKLPVSSLNETHMVTPGQYDELVHNLIS